MEKAIVKEYKDFLELANKLADEDVIKYKIRSSDAKLLMRQKHLIDMLLMYSEKCGYEYHCFEENKEKSNGTTT